jgi:hypothetical protein
MAKKDVNTLKPATPAEAQKIKQQARMKLPPSPAAGPPPAAERATHPGTERWSIKTGTDAGADQVGDSIVETTVEEMVSVERPADMLPPTDEIPKYENTRAVPVETTIWSLDAVITAIKFEADGDYHLVLQGASGETMIGEIPTPDPPFVQASSPWVDNIRAARTEVDNNLVNNVPTAGFVPVGGKLVPPEAVGPQTRAQLKPSHGGAGGAAGRATFKTRIEPRRVKVTGVGFFDRIHGQMGVSPTNGIEIHPILKIEFLP